MRHLSGRLALGALLAFASACAATTDTVETETRGALTVQTWGDGDAIVAEVSITASSQLVASFTCDVATGVLRTDAPGSGDTVDRALPACDPAGLTELAFLIGDQLAAAPASYPDGVDEIAYDEGGCDITPGRGNSCCARHDACYAAYDCTAWSWFYLWGDCDRCNREAVVCYLGGGAE
jgi:hypothetical protein